MFWCVSKSLSKLRYYPGMDYDMSSWSEFRRKHIIPPHDLNYLQVWWRTAPTVRNETVMLTMMKSSMRKATQEKEGYLCLIIYKGGILMRFLDQLWQLVIIQLYLNSKSLIAYAVCTSVKGMVEISPWLADLKWSKLKRLWWNNSVFSIYRVKLTNKIQEPSIY